MRSQLARAHLDDISFIKSLPGAGAKAFVCTTVRVDFAARPEAAVEEEHVEASDAAAESSADENKLVVQLITLEKKDVTSGTYPLEP